MLRMTLKDLKTVSWRANHLMADVDSPITHIEMKDKRFMVLHHMRGFVISVTEDYMAIWKDEDHFLNEEGEWNPLLQMTFELGDGKIPSLFGQTIDFLHTQRPHNSNSFVPVQCLKCDRIYSDVDVCPQCGNDDKEQTVFLTDYDPYTDPRYWDCECEKDYMHPKSLTSCSKCRAQSKDQPDSIVSELLTTFRNYKMPQEKK